MGKDDKVQVLGFMIVPVAVVPVGLSWTLRSEKLKSCEGGSTSHSKSLNCIRWVRWVTAFCLLTPPPAVLLSQ